MTETITSPKLQKVDAAYQSFSGLMESAIAGKDINKLDGKLLDIYVDLAGASDRGGLESASMGNRGAFMEATMELQRGIQRQAGLPRAFQNIGQLIVDFEDSVKPLHQGFLSETSVGDLLGEGVKPVKGLANAGKHQGYQEGILHLLKSQDSRKEYGLAA
ncbi:hypothetical protein HOF78_01550 [Candidatus Woesearchaeota archaeon]|jgi:hypothetical protein|nr:hypothetical protein [Candidatus Woesearchaeota archaeon]MBT6044811.1 hypothetical protein [Candidatus Woesearchaeota archaeon]